MINQTCETCRYKKKWPNKKTCWTCQLTKLPIIYFTDNCLGWQEAQEMPEQPGAGWGL